MPGELLLDVALQRRVVPSAESLADGAELRIRRAGEDAADFVDVVDDAAAGCGVDDAGFLLDELGVDRVRGFVAFCAEDEGEEGAGFEGEVGFDVLLEGSVECVLVGGLDGVEIGV